ncbi:VanZ family protein [Streptomyces flavidovirens]|uniref:VanZ family protein n=1 Tax=Streptomyces flavidovirens TaxID=67298 RepID=UPI0036872304
MATLFALPTALVAKARKRPVVIPTLFAASLAGVLAITLLPGNAGSAMDDMCDMGSPTHMLTSSSALLNIILFIPAALLAVIVFRRPVTVAAASMLCSGTVELIQATGALGRSCSVTDIAANATGALLGACAGAAWLWLREKRIEGLLRDVCWGGGLAVAGTAALAGLFHSSVAPVDVVATENRRDTYMQSLEGSDEWMTGAIKDVFGEGTKATATVMDKSGSRTRITMTTNRGEVTGWWPDRTLERAWTTDEKVEDGDLSERQVRATGKSFAQQWFPDSVASSRETIEGVGEGNAKVYVLTYRRYKNDVMMPMRLDITITASGRMMGFASKPVPDPVLPATAISQDDAMRLAKKETGAEAEAAVLLAQEIGGHWRPVWMVGVKSNAQEPDVFLDAVSGERVKPD